jgi:hypothetical protein
MGAAGRGRVEREFTWDRIAARFLEALEDKTGRLLEPEPAVRPYEKQAEAGRLAG